MSNVIWEIKFREDFVKALSLETYSLKALQSLINQPDKRYKELQKQIQEIKELLKKESILLRDVSDASLNTIAKRKLDDIITIIFNKKLQEEIISSFQKKIKIGDLNEQKNIMCQQYPDHILFINKLFNEQKDRLFNKKLGELLRNEDIIENNNGLSIKFNELFDDFYKPSLLCNAKEFILKERIKKEMEQVTKNINDSTSLNILMLKIMMSPSFCRIDPSINKLMTKKIKESISLLVKNTHLIDDIKPVSLYGLLQLNHLFDLEDCDFIHDMRALLKLMKIKKEGDQFIEGIEAIYNNHLQKTNLSKLFFCLVITDTLITISTKYLNKLNNKQNDKSFLSYLNKSPAEKIALIEELLGILKNNNKDHIENLQEFCSKYKEIKKCLKAPRSYISPFLLQVTGSQYCDEVDELLDKIESYIISNNLFSNTCSKY